MITETITNIIERMYSNTGYSAKYIVLNNYTYHKLLSEVQRDLNYSTIGGGENDVEKYRSIPILIRAGSHEDVEYIEVIPKTHD